MEQKNETDKKKTQNIVTKQNKQKNRRRDNRMWNKKKNNIESLKYWNLNGEKVNNSSIF